VSTSLRFAEDEQPIEQLQPLAGLEHPDLDQALVLDALPASKAKPRLLGRGHRSRA
jgi:hypothetical protein